MKKVLSTLVLTILIVCARAQSPEKIYSLWGANISTASWVKLGTLTASQGGVSSTMVIYAGQGYNGWNNQMGSVELFIRTSNGATVGPGGYGFGAYATRYGGTPDLFTRMKIVPNNAGATATAYDIYAYVSPYIGSGYYTVKGDGGWTPSMTVTTEPATAYEVPFLFKIQCDASLAGGALLAQVSTGNVGIGTSTPTEKLSVKGTILAQKIKVSTAASNWPDYVFNTEYKLPSILELEKFVKAHHHLPEVPSAKEVEANGLDLGETNKQLLKKLEELTLYIIELKKENLAQQAAIETLQKELPKK